MQKYTRNTNHKTNINVVLRGLFCALSSYVAILNMRQTQVSTLEYTEEKIFTPLCTWREGIELFHLVHRQVTRETEIFHLVHKTILFHLYCFSLSVYSLFYISDYNLNSKQGEVTSLNLYLWTFSWFWDHHTMGYHGCRNWSPLYWKSAIHSHLGLDCVTTRWRLAGTPRLH